MPVLERIENFLDDLRVPFARSAHAPAFTAREVSEAENVSSRKIAKTVVLVADGAFVMAVLPADSIVDIQELRRALGATHLRLATEVEIGQLFPDCELGAMPPFGNLYGLPVYAEVSLAQQHTIAFNAGTHRDVVYMNFSDFRRAVNPVMLPFARRVAA